MFSKTLHLHLTYLLQLQSNSKFNRLLVNTDYLPITFIYLKKAKNYLNQNLKNLDSSGKDHQSQKHFQDTLALIFIFSYQVWLYIICDELLLFRVQHRFQNITCRVGQAAPKVYLPHQHFLLPRHWLFNKGGLHCEGVVLLARLPLLPNSLATCNGASGYVALCLGMWESCQWLGVRQCFSLGKLVSSISYNWLDLAAIWQKKWQKTKFQKSKFS